MPIMLPNPNSGIDTETATVGVRLHAFSSVDIRNERARLKATLLYAQFPRSYVDCKPVD
jgi:hypothetical protein